MPQEIGVAASDGQVEITVGTEPDFQSIWLDEADTDRLRDLLIGLRPIEAPPADVVLRTEGTESQIVGGERLSERTTSVVVRGVTIFRTTQRIRGPLLRGDSGYTGPIAFRPDPVLAESGTQDPFGLWTTPTVLEVLEALGDGDGRTTGEVAVAIDYNPESRDVRSCLLFVLGGLAGNQLAERTGQGRATLWTLTEAGKAERIRLRRLSVR
jgi:hypothetical protein